MAYGSTYSEDTGYVNIHGQDVRVLVCNKTGSIAIPIDEVKEMGFRLYRKSQYSRLLIDDNQFGKEFYMYMLDCAQTYMLKKEIVFKENDILENINKCKAALTGNQSHKFSLTPPRHSVVRSETPSNPVSLKTLPGNFAENHVVESSPDRITVTANLREFSARVKQSAHNDARFRGFVKTRSPAASVNSADSCHFENNHERRVFGESSFEQRKPLSPRTPNDNIAKNSFNKSNNRQNDVEDNEEPAKRLETIVLNKPEHKVLISFIEKANTVWVQDVDNCEVLLEIDGKIKEDINKEEEKIYRLAWNKMYLALSQEDDMWYRCRAIKFNPLTVFFVDYGNTAEVPYVRKASESLSKIPCQAIKIIFNETQYNPVLYETITIRTKKRFENGSYAVDVKTDQEPPCLQAELPKIPSIPTFFTKPQPLCPLENGQRVMLLSHMNGKLALRTKECYDKFKQVEKALEERGAKAELVEKVERGQLVLCKRGKFQRGMVKDIQSGGVVVELLDHCDTVNVDLSNLRHINEGLAMQSLTYVLTPQIKGCDDNVDEILQQLCQKSVKGTVVLSANNDFDIKLVDGFLSDKLKPQHSGRPMLKDFQIYTPPLGLDSYICNVYENKDSVYFTSEKALVEHLKCVIISEMEDTDAYEPVVGEVCLGFYQDSWSRCVVMNVTNRRYEVRFIDFGNADVLKADLLRKLTDDAKGAPVLAFCCKLTGLPSVNNVEDRIKQNLTDGELYDVNVKKLDGVTYEIEIPALYQALKK